jgi:hypothetical protein
MEMKPSLVANPFLELLQSVESTKPMTKQMTELMVMAVMSESEDGLNGKPELLVTDDDETTEIIERDKKLPFPMRVLKGRLVKAELPINFTVNGAIAMTAVTHGNPGRMVAGLVNILTHYVDVKKSENHIVNVSDVVRVYPNGDLNEENMLDYIDNYLKPNRVKWAELY